jgi:hypothetical protein
MTLLFGGEYLNLFGNNWKFDNFVLIYKREVKSMKTLKTQQH